jgi:hypothetical protein
MMTIKRAMGRGFIRMSDRSILLTPHLQGATPDPDPDRRSPMSGLLLDIIETLDEELCG